MSDDKKKDEPKKPENAVESLKLEQIKAVKMKVAEGVAAHAEAAKGGSGADGDINDGDINDEEAWSGIRQNWAEEQADRAKAHALKFFEADDDLPLSTHFLFSAIVVFFVIIIVWANFASLEEVTRGDGKVIPSSDIQALQTLEAGIVDEFLVHEGDEVVVGQILVRMSDIDASSDLGAGNARYYGLLAAITRLQAEAGGKSRVDFPKEIIKASPSSVTEELKAFRANMQAQNGQMNILHQQLQQREQEVREMRMRASDIRGVISLQRQEKEMIAPLVARGSAPKLELLQLERTIKEKDTELNSTLSGMPRAKSAAGEVRARIKDLKNSFQAQAQTELTAKQVELNEIKERLSSLTERKTRTEIKSPVNGTVKEMMFNTVGGVIRPGEDIIQIVPKDDQLLVEARIRPSDIAFLYPGQKAIVKITAYDFSIYGGLPGKVLDISADTIEDEEGNSFYRVRVKTDETELVRKGEILPIIPGMVASIDVLTGEKTVMQYLMKPFFKTLDNAMTER